MSLHGAYTKYTHTQDEDDCMDVVSGCRHPKYNHSSAWLVFEQLSPGLCETSAHPPETALSTYSPVKHSRAVTEFYKL